MFLQVKNKSTHPSSIHWFFALVSPHAALTILSAGGASQAKMVDWPITRRRMITRLMAAVMSFSGMVAKQCRKRVIDPAIRFGAGGSSFSISRRPHLLLLLLTTPPTHHLMSLLSAALSANTRTAIARTLSTAHRLPRHYCARPPTFRYLNVCDACRLD